MKPKQLEYLRQIYDSESQNIILESKDDLRYQKLKALVDCDLLEIEGDELSFYLTEYGYDCIENPVEEENHEYIEPQYEQIAETVSSFGAKRLKKYIFILLAFFAFSGGIYAYFTLHAFRKTNPDLKHLDLIEQELMNNLEEMSDSIQTKEKY